VCAVCNEVCTRRSVAAQVPVLVCAAAVVHEQKVYLVRSQVGLWC